MQLGLGFHHIEMILHFHQLPFLSWIQIPLHLINIKRSGYLVNTDTAALYIDFNQEIPKNQGELQQHHPCEAMNSVVPIGFISLSVVKN